MPPKTSSKDINKLLRKAEKQGWKFKGDSHIICFAPNGKDIVTVSVSPKDRTSTKKVENDLRKAGLKI